MEIFSITNQKGGTGKTTTAVNLGRALAFYKKKVLLIDLDPQANLTYSFGIRSPETTISDALRSMMQGENIFKSILISKEGLDIAPASRDLADLELSLIRKVDRENVLKNCLKGLQGYDFVFIDSAPSLSILTVNSLNSADGVLIPLQMEILALEGLTQLFITINEVKRELNNRLKIEGIIPSMFDNRRKLSIEILEQVRINVKERIFNTVIRECVKIAEAPSFAKSVIQYSPFSHATEDFLKLAKEFLKNRS